MYFSTKQTEFVFVDSRRETIFRVNGRGIGNGELDLLPAVPPRLRAGKLPHDVIESRAQVVNDLPRQDANAGIYGLLKRDLSVFLKDLVLFVGHSWVAAEELERLPGGEKIGDFDIQLLDILVGPF
jgi:hypothetical protein